MFGFQRVGDLIDAGATVYVCGDGSKLEPDVKRALMRLHASRSGASDEAAARWIISTDRGDRFLGCSLIAGTNGWLLSEVAGAEEETILYADVDLVSARSAPIWNSLNDLPRDRRVDLYGSMLGYDRHAALPR